MAKKQIDPSKLQELGTYDFTGKVSDVIARLQKIVDRHPNAVIRHELDWGVCFYEGDTPTSIFKVSSK